MESTSRALALREEKVPGKEICFWIKRSKATIMKILSQAKGHPAGYIPCHKPIIKGRPRKTSRKSDKLLKKEVEKDPMISSTQLRRIHPNLFKNVSLRTIPHRLQKDLNMPSRRAAKKPLLTDKMKQKRLEFAYQYKDWTKEMWNSVMFSDESMFKCIRSACNRVRCPPGSNRFASKYTIKTVKHPDSVMLLGAYSGKMGRAGVYFLPKKCTMNSERYIELLETHFLQCSLYMNAKFLCKMGYPVTSQKKL